jgi:hypothetical protein
MGVETMILYTEKQLQTAYILYVRSLHENNQILGNYQMDIPSLEEFRLIYEAEIELEYNGDNIH